MLPPELRNCTPLEYRITSPAAVIMQIYCVRGTGTVRSKGNSCAIEQDIDPIIAKSMPLRVPNSGVLLMRVAGSTSTHKACTVRRDVVRQLILFHQSSGTPRYPQEIDETYLATLPEDGVPEDLRIMEVDSEEQINAVDQGPPLRGKPETEKLRFVGRPVKAREQEHVVRSAILEEDPFVEYPKVGDTPYNEWNTPWLGSLIFPHLFPGGRGDPWDPERSVKVSIQKCAEHLLHFRHEDKIKTKNTTDEYLYPFAEDALFVCWIGNVCHRHKVITQVGVYMNTHR